MKRLEKYLPFVIAVVGILAYANSFDKSFVFDDSVIITENRYIDRLMPLTWHPRFLAELSFKLNFALSGFNILGYRLVNIIIHLIAGLLLYGTVRRTLCLSYFQSKYRASASWLAFMSAVIWVIHPLQTESVTYICQRSESMMGMFYLFVLYSIIRAHESSRKTLWYSTAFLAFIAGISTKEVMMTAPVIIFLYDHIFLAGSLRKQLYRKWWLLTGIAIVAAASVWLFIGHAGVALRTQTASHALSMNYFFTQFEVIAHYLKLSVSPNPLCIDYGWEIAEGISDVLPAVVFISILFITAVIAAIKRLPSGFPGMWFFIILAPTSSFVPIRDAAFEHRMYLPLAAIIVLITITTHHIQEKLFGGLVAKDTSKRIVFRSVLPLAVCFVMITLTVKRNMDYQTPETLWRQTIRVRPQNPRPYFALGLELAKKGSVQEAEDLFNRLLVLLPDNIDQESRGVHHTLYAKTRNAIGIIRVTENAYTDAEKEFREAVRIAPNYVEAKNNLGIVLRDTGRPDEALIEWSEALKEHQGDGTTRHGTTHYCIAALNASKGNYSRAIGHYEKALMFRPVSIDAKIQLAWLLATCPMDEHRNGRRAVELIGKIENVIPVEENARILDVKAAVLAEVGEYERAIIIGEKALRLATEQDIELRIEIEKRLNLYRTGKAFRLSASIR
ncbi:tetratricopeptide repeat protein [Verrucomicrobiota bacterium]